MQIESAIFWIILALVLVVFSVFTQAADFIAHCLGIYSTANFLFLFAIFILILKVFYMTIHISQLETKIKELVQRMALEERIRAEEGRAAEGQTEERQAGFHGIVPRNEKITGDGYAKGDDEENK